MFKPWTNTNSLPQGPGYYHLTSDVTLADTWNVPHDETHLCLNGNKIILDQSSDANKAVVNIAQSNEIPHKLVLYDKEDNTGTITHASGQTGSGVQVVDGGDFVMKGGTISGNDAHNYGGGGVFVGEGDQNKSATFDMDGGIIAHNIGSRYGSGVAVDGGTFTMSGGTITQNAARNGGGVADVFNF